MAVGQKDIADRLNVSVATVSRSLRDDPQIPRKTRTSVQAAAAILGYRMRARQSRTAEDDDSTGSGGVRRNVFVLLLPSTSLDSTFHAYDSNYQQAIAGLSEAAAEMNTSVIIHALPPAKMTGVHKPENQPEIMRGDTPVRGAILLGEFDPEAVEGLSQQFPCISIARLYTDYHVDYVGPDNTEGTAALVKHLIDLGHRRIGFVGGWYNASFFEERLTGYVTGLIRNGLSVSEDHMIRSVDEPATWQTADAAQHWAGRQFGVLKRWLTNGVTALVCVNDGVALLVRQWLTDNGFQCPGDVSITGFDGRILPESSPSLTTAKVHFHDLGFRAVHKLAWRGEHPATAATRTLVRSTLVTGDSTRAITDGEGGVDS